MPRLALHHVLTFCVPRRAAHYQAPLLICAAPICLRLSNSRVQDSVLLKINETSHENERENAHCLCAWMYLAVISPHGLTSQGHYWNAIIRWSAMVH